MKRLYKSRKNKVIDGVCGGIAEYLDVDPVLVRLAAVLFIFLGGTAVIAYIIGMIIIPPEPKNTAMGVETAADQIPAIPPPPGQKESRSRTGSLIIGIILLVFGAHFLLRNIPFFNLYYLRLWDLGWHFFWPSILILIGLLIVLRGMKK